MKLGREETKIMVTGRSIYRKTNLKFKGRNWNLNRNVGKKIGTRTRTRNRNLGKMARFRNTGFKIYTVRETSQEYTEMQRENYKICSNY
jgi:hypothetical protein